MEFDLKERTKEFAIRIMSLAESIPKTLSGKTIANQIIRSGTSVGANYRATCRSRSDAEFISKLGIVIEEADETIFWIELLIEKDLMKSDLLEPILKEANEILSIMISSKQTIIKRKKDNS